MKKTLCNLVAGAFVVASFQCLAQGTLIYDQQSANGPTSPFGKDFFNIQADSPLMQSFTPTLSAIAFVQFQFWDIPNNGYNGATVYANLWFGSSSPSSATLLGSTAPVFVSDGFGSGYPGVTNLYFSNPIALNPGETYYLQPVVLSGDNPFDILVLGNTAPFGDYYTSGTLFAQGTDTAIDLWFREGIVSFVPEPSSLALIGLSTLLVFVRMHLRKLLLIAGVSLATLANGQTFYLESLGGAGSVPYPMNPYDNSVPVTEISSDQYLI